MEKQQSIDIFQEQQRFIKGKLIVMIFHNEETVYSVARIRIIETNEQYEDKEVIVAGYFPYIHEDEVYTFFGQFHHHPRHGLQYQVHHFKKELPQSEDGIIQYLSSDLFVGIGKKTAQKIVKALGERAITKIIENPSVLMTIPKFPEEKAKHLYQTLMLHEGLEQIMIALSNYGFGPQLSMKIYQTYKEDTLEIIQDNPYKLIEDVEGIGFTRADELGQSMGIKGNHPDRIRAGCLYTLNQQSIQDGHVYLNIEPFIIEVYKLINEKAKENKVSEVDISREIISLGEEEKIIVEEDRVYLPSLFFAEKGLVTSLKRIAEQEKFNEQFPESEFLMALGSLEERLQVQYAPSQKDAIQTAITSPIMIMTGGPGTGKTTVIKGIVEIYSQLHGYSLNPKDYKKDESFPFILAAPTGRAAKRMTESTGLPAVTIHRLLGWNGSEGFSHDEENPIGGKLVIIDEFSMVDIWLANQLFKALPDEVQVILVGDEDQLPSVGPGQVLKDLLMTEKIKTVRLTDIYRQSEGSSIIDLAHSIKVGKLPTDITSPKVDRAFFKCKQGQILDVVSQVCQNALKKGYTARDVQVLAPMYRGSAGIDTLNKMLQLLFNPKSDQKRELSFGEIIYRVGDKVLQLINQPDDNVFNGDIGEIVSIIYAKENTEGTDQIIISFEGIEVLYTRQDLSKITHAYCCSIHKSQGSEFPIVIFPVVKGYYRMLRRNLIYTAITRSKDYLILCGDEEALRQGVLRQDEGLRKTTLAVKITERFNENNVEKQEETNMESLSPYDFM
ncbi:SF1B family DNA helicase RecD2 [Calidifontibacillus oryziterrae]|uniref:SF1B family DNA helicase RecD2 n=1 Tax=Calidifontibacillus oryziterrae TaxID=1191699 RepID=UPI0002D9EC51|nr:ATP-dependent RecD-like DNA helicase [Calidifontibacillus oryziterrae]